MRRADTRPVPTPVRFEVTLASGRRLLRAVAGLLERPQGWSLPALARELAVAPRTIDRYVAAFLEDFVDAQGRPYAEVVVRGGRKFLRATSALRLPDASPYQALSFHLARGVLGFLDGTVLRAGVEDLWERFAASLPPDQRRRLTDLGRKIHYVPFAEKSYRQLDTHMDTILRCLVDQRRMRVDYTGRTGVGKVHVYEPYTLVVYRGGLYLIGQSDRAPGKQTYLAVERIRRVERLAERFEYPRRYSPKPHLAGVFGLIEGETLRVELLLRDTGTAELLRARQIHPTQRFQRRRDGTTLLTMRVRGMTELASWVLSLGAHVEVLRPRELREEVAGQLREAVGVYGEV
jgi:predicted DNA-binding transcriptional regulator YafY